MKCILGQKIGDSLILDDDGNLQSIYPDVFYSRNMYAYWQLKKMGDFWVIVKVFRVIDENGR